MAENTSATLTMDRASVTHVAVFNDVNPTFQNLVLLLPSSDGTENGVSQYGIWSGILRSFKREGYNVPNSDFELTTSEYQPEYVNLLFDLADPDDIPEEMDKILPKVDGVDKDKLQLYCRTKKSQSTRHWYIRGSDAVFDFIRDECNDNTDDGRWNRIELYTHLVTGILLIVPYYCLQSKERVAHLSSILVNRYLRVGVSRGTANNPWRITGGLRLGFMNVDFSVPINRVDGSVGIEKTTTVADIYKNCPDSWKGIHAHLTTSNDNGQMPMVLSHAAVVCDNYRPYSSICESERSEMDVIVKKLEGIRHHTEGGVVRSAIWRTLGAWLYISFSFALAVSVGSLNWGDRKAPYLQVTDTIQTLTVMWVGVFGFIKLFSGDDQAIRNLLLGRRIMRNIEDVRRYVRAKDLNTLKAAMMKTKRLEWLDPAECGFVKASAHGSIRALGGISIAQCLRSGMLLLGDRLFLNEDSNECYALHWRDSGVHLMDRTDLGKMQCNYQVFPENASIA